MCGMSVCVCMCCVHQFMCVLVCVHVYCLVCNVFMCLHVFFVCPPTYMHYTLLLLLCVCVCVVPTVSPAITLSGGLAPECGWVG